MAPIMHQPWVGRSSVVLENFLIVYRMCPYISATNPVGETDALCASSLRADGRRSRVIVPKTPWNSAYVLRRRDDTGFSAFEKLKEGSRSVKKTIFSEHEMWHTGNDRAFPPSARIHGAAPHLCNDNLWICRLCIARDSESLSAATEVLNIKIDYAPSFLSQAIAGGLSLASMSQRHFETI